MKLCKASHRNTQSHWVYALGVRVLFSYETAVAMGYDGKCIRRSNDWGPTTGRHMKEAGVTNWRVVEEGEFNRELNHALMVAGMEAFKEHLK